MSTRAVNHHDERNFRQRAKCWLCLVIEEGGSSGVAGLTVCSFKAFDWILTLQPLPQGYSQITENGLRVADSGALVQTAARSTRPIDGGVLLDSTDELLQIFWGFEIKWLDFALVCCNTVLYCLSDINMSWAAGPDRGARQRQPVLSSPSFDLSCAPVRPHLPLTGREEASRGRLNVKNLLIFLKHWERLASRQRNPAELSTQQCSAGQSGWNPVNGYQPGESGGQAG